MLYGPAFQALKATVRAEQPYCGTCHRTERLECHHRHYRNGSEPNREDLIMLCKECHDAITEVHRRRRDVTVPKAKNRPLPAVPKQPARADTPVQHRATTLAALNKPMLKDSKHESLQSLHSYHHRHKPATLSQWSDRGPAEPVFKEDEIVVS